MITLEQMTKLLTLYSVNGTSVPGGITAGSSNNDGSEPYILNNIGDAFPFQIINNYNSEDDNLITVQVSPNSSMYLDLSSIENPFTKQDIVNGQRRLELVSAAALGITTTTVTSDLSFTLSGEDQWLQKMTYANNFGTVAFLNSRPFKYLASAYVVNSSPTETLEFKLNTSSYFELKYFTIVGAPIIMANCATLSDPYIVSEDDNTVNYNFQILPSAQYPDSIINGNTGITNSVRPIVNLSNVGSVTITQNVMGMGYLPPFYTYKRATFINNLRSVIGAPQYSENWVGWQG